MKLLYPLATFLVTAAAILPASGAPTSAPGASSWAAARPSTRAYRPVAGLSGSNATLPGAGLMDRKTATASAQPVPSPTIITSVPYTISEPGYYQLGADLYYAGNSAINNDAIITVAASNVVLDFAGHYISGPNNNNSTNLYGIYATERGNLVIENGTIAFCYYGMAVRGSGQTSSLNINQRIDNMLVSYCYYVGISLENPRNSEVANCRVSSINFSGSSSSAYGIEIFSGTGNKAMNNTVTTVTAADGTAYALSGGSGYYASGNIISDVTAASSGTAYGIYQPVFAVHNAISNAQVGISGGKYQDNLTSNCATPFTGGTDAGGNN